MQYVSPLEQPRTIDLILMNCFKICCNFYTHVSMCKGFKFVSATTTKKTIHPGSGPPQTAKINFQQKLSAFWRLHCLLARTRFQPEISCFKGSFWNLFAFSRSLSQHSVWNGFYFTTSDRLPDSFHLFIESESSNCGVLVEERLSALFSRSELIRLVRFVFRFQESLKSYE